MIAIPQVILVAYDARRERAYWLDVQGYFRQRPRRELFAAGTTVTLKVAVENVVNARAMRTFRKLRNRAISREADNDD